MFNAAVVEGLTIRRADGIVRSRSGFEVGIRIEIGWRFSDGDAGGGMGSFFLDLVWHLQQTLQRDQA
ncbi:MAG: hypothetical protein ACYCV7_15220, partial [Acidimicrobiales bacterium]